VVCKTDINTKISFTASSEQIPFFVYGTEDRCRLAVEQDFLVSDYIRL
jgi:hypothetical protein